MSFLKKILQVDSGLVWVAWTSLLAWRFPRVSQAVAHFSPKLDSVEVLNAADAKNILLPQVEAIEALAEEGPWRGVRCPLMGKCGRLLWKHAGKLTWQWKMDLLKMY